jgi:Uma2 family endonuclease
MLLEKTVGALESYLAMRLGHLIQIFLDATNLGIVLGSQGMLRLAPGLIRIPDVSFISWGRFPEGTLPEESVWGLSPDLAVEIISPSNTREEMERKLRDYFDTGVHRVWYAYPDSREIRVYSAADAYETMGPGQTLDAGDVLPGFQLDVQAFFTKPGPPATGR